MDSWNTLLRRVEAAHGVVTHGQLLAAGLSPTGVGRLRASGRLVSIHHGVYRIGGAPPTFEAQVAAALADDTSDGCAWGSHGVGLRINGMRGRSRFREIEITRSYGTSAARAGVIVHRSTCIPPHHVTVVHGLPVTTPARTAFDMARYMSEAELTRVLAHALQTRTVACTLPALYRVLYDLGGRGRPGTRRFRSVLDTWDPLAPPSESVLDDLGRALLAPVPGIEWQVEVSDERGYIRRVDALVGPASLVLEFDSIFHDDPLQRAHDDSCDRRLAALGLTTRRLRWHDVTRRGDLTLAEVLRAARAAA